MDTNKAWDKDGNKINVNRNEPLKFYFKGDSLFRSTNEQYSYRESYKIRNNILSIGKKTGNIELACEAWEKLKNMRQKDGENLYNKTAIQINRQYVNNLFQNLIQPIFE
jgi:hypothetical protein